MNMSPHLRKFAITAHVSFSVGWIGAVAGFLALAIAGLVSRHDQTLRAAYLAMELISWFVIVPLSFAAPLTGLVMSLGTPWGLFRHWWLLAKFLITIPCTLLLLMHMKPIVRMSDAAAETALFGVDLSRLQFQLAADSALALLVLLVTTTLALYKPRGMTRYGARKQEAELAPSHSNPPHRHSGDSGVRFDSGPSVSTPRWVIILGIILFALMFTVRTFTVGGMSGH